MHKLDKFYVNTATKEITVKINRQHVKVVDMPLRDKDFDGIIKVMDAKEVSF